MRLCELREKEVINLCTCKRLGCVCDVELDLCKGCLESLIVPEAGKFHGFFGYNAEYVIPFSCVKQVGKDLIMVEICEEKYLKSCKD